MIQDNQSINSFTEEYLDYYCALSHAPGFAVLLKGPWGSGKTWFIKKYIKKLINQKQKYLYVSLNGISLFSEIEEAFLVQQIPFLASKPVAIARNIITQSLKGTFKIDFDNDKALSLGIPSASLTEYLTNVSESILIFDDLERCDIDLENMLGYINNFVEHKELKVIIVANEEKILEKKDTYKDIKEKLIGGEFAIYPDFNGALENFLKKADNLQARNFLSENSDLIQNLFLTGKYENLRTLNQIILNFARVFESLPDKAKNRLDILKEILSILTVLLIEIKSGVIIPKDIDKLSQEYISSFNDQIGSYPSLNLSANTKKESNPASSIFQRYSIDFYTLFPSPTWWKAFFYKGILDAEELDEALISSKYFQDETTPNWKKLWHYYDLTDDDFDKLLLQVGLEYANRDFDDPGVVKHITGMFLNFSDIKVLQKSKEEILKDSKLYIDYLMDCCPSTLLSYSLSTADNMFRGYLGLGFQGVKLEEFNEFCSYLEKSQKLVKNNDMLNVGQELLNVMQSDIFKFEQMICLTALPYKVAVSQQYHKIPVLKYIKETDFLEKLLSIVKFEDKDYVCRILIKRYDIANLNQELIEELDWLKSVRNLLLEEIARKQGKISAHTLKIHIEPTLSEAIKKLESSILSPPE